MEPTVRHRRSEKRPPPGLPRRPRHSGRRRGYDRSRDRGDHGRRPRAFFRSLQVACLIAGLVALAGGAFAAAVLPARPSAAPATPLGTPEAPMALAEAGNSK